MTSLVENYVRRIEKIIESRSTVPLPGTNHIDDLWLNSDIYPGELSINLTTGSLYTSDGESIIELNKENAILEGLVAEKDTSGVNKITITTGSARINGRTYLHSSSGTDIFIPFNVTAVPKIHFLYGIPTLSVVGDPSNGNYLLGLTSSSYDVTDLTSNTIIEPHIDNSLLLGLLLLNVGATGYELWPISVANTGDYYPRFSTTATELIRLYTEKINHYSEHSLYFSDQFIIDSLSNTIYLSKKIFISDYNGIANDILAQNIVPIGGSGGTGGNSAINLGAGLNIYKAQVGTQFQFKTVLNSGLITLTDASDTITIGLTTSGLITSISNVGSGATIYKGLTSTSVAQLRSLTAGTNVSIGLSGDNIIISVPSIGTTAQGINLGSTASADIYAGMSGKDLTFRRLIFGTGISGSQSSNSITISSTGKDNKGTNIGSGLGLIYGGMTGDNLMFRSLSGGSNVTISNSGDTIIISASGGGSSITEGENIGSTDPHAGVIYKGMSGPNLTFGSIIPGTNMSISNIGNDIQLDVTVSDGAQGPMGFQGRDGNVGATGTQGTKGFQGTTGNTGSNGTQGPIGYQGLMGFQGFTGPTGPMGNQRVIDIIDDIGGVTITPSNSRYFNFNTTTPRINTDSVLFTTGLISQSPPDGNYVQVNEDGTYMFIYAVTLLTAPLASGVVSLWNYTTNREVEGSQIWFKSGAVNETRTNTGKVAINATSGTQFALKIENNSGSGNIYTVLQSSSFLVTKLEVGFGPTGNTGPGGSGPQGFQGAMGWQGLVGPGSTAAGTQGYQGYQGFQGTQGEVGTQGFQGAGSLSSVVTQIPIYGTGSSGSPVAISYHTGDFGLTSSNLSGGTSGIMLNLDFTDIVIPTTAVSWNVRKSDNSTPLPTYSIGGYGSIGSVMYGAISVPNGAYVDVAGSTASIPASSTGFSTPTNVSGSWTWSPNPPISYPANSLTISGTTTNLTSTTTYSITLTKPKSGFIVSNNRVVRASGSDTSSSSKAVTFQSVFYFGYLVVGPALTPISQVEVDAITAANLEGLGNYRFGTKSQTFTSNDSTPAGARLVIAYLASAGNLTSVLFGGSTLNQIGGFTKATTAKSITTISGAAYSYIYYVANAANSWNGTFTIS